MKTLSRTRISDPSFNDGSGKVDEIPLKSFSASILKNLTDVCCNAFLPLQQFDDREQNHTHPAAYYQPIFDVPEDHGTVRTSYPPVLSDGNSL